MKKTAIAFVALACALLAGCSSMSHMLARVSNAIGPPAHRQVKNVLATLEEDVTERNATGLMAESMHSRAWIARIDGVRRAIVCDALQVPACARFAVYGRIDIEEAHLVPLDPPWTLGANDTTFNDVLVVDRAHKKKD